MLLLILPNSIIHEWSRINMKTCANIQTLCSQPPVAFCECENPPAKILVILILDALCGFVYGEKKHRAFGFACRECRRRSHKLISEFCDSYISCRTSKTVDFTSILQECQSRAGTARIALWIWQPCDLVSRSKQTNELTRMQATTVTTTKSMAKCYLEWHNKSLKLFGVCQPKWISLFENPNIESSRSSSFRLLLLLRTIYKFGTPFTQALIVEHLMRTRRKDYEKNERLEDVLRLPFYYSAHQRCTLG